MSQAKPAPKELNLKGLAMQAGLKFSGRPTRGRFTLCDRSRYSFPVWGTAALCTITGAAVGWATYEVIQKVKEGKQRDGTPKSNGAQNDQFADAVREIERKIGKKLSDKQWDELHDEISGQDYGYTARDSKIGSGCGRAATAFASACIAKLFKFSCFGVGFA